MQLHRKGEEGGSATCPAMLPENVCGHLSQSPSYVPFPLPFSLLLNPVVIVWVLNRQPNVQLLAFRWE